MTQTGQQNLGELLLSEGLVTEDQLNQAKGIHQETGKTVCAALVEMGAITEAIKNSLLKKKFGFDAVTVEAERRDEAVLKLLPRREASRHRAIPLRLENEALIVAMEEPNNILVVDYLKTLTGHRIQPVSTSAVDIDRALKAYPDEARGGIDIGDQVPIVRFLIKLFSAFFYFLVPCVLFVFLYWDLYDFQKRIQDLSKFEIFFYLFIIWGTADLIIWYIQGLIFTPQQEEVEEEGAEG